MCLTEVGKLFSTGDARDLLVRHTTVSDTIYSIHLSRI